MGRPGLRRICLAVVPLLRGSCCRADCFRRLTYIQQSREAASRNTYISIQKGSVERFRQPFCHRGSPSRRRRFRMVRVESGANTSSAPRESRAVCIHCRKTIFPWDSSVRRSVLYSGKRRSFRSFWRYRGSRTVQARRISSGASRIQCSVISKESFCRRIRSIRRPEM